MPPPEPIPAKASLPVNTAQKQGLIAPFNNGKNRTPPPVKLSREPGRKPNQLIVERDGQETVGDSNARIVASPVLANVSTIARFASSEGQPDVTTLAMSITASAERIQAGDTSDIKAMLLSQAQACQAIFSEMARRSALNLGQHLGHAETYMRLALKAQAQSRATLETLAEIVSPRPVYINPQQVNHANGPQQVNNSIPARVRESDISSNKLLEGK